MSVDTINKKQAIVLGLAIGDSLSNACPFELVRPCVLAREVPATENESEWPLNYAPNSRQTDDTEQSLILLRCLQHMSDGSMSCFVKCLVKWKNSHPQEISAFALKTLQYAEYFHKKNPTDANWWLQGAKLRYNQAPDEVALNGSLMRNGIVAAWTLDKSEYDAIRFSVLQSIATHYAPLCVLSCVIHTLMIRLISKNPAHKICTQDIKDAFASWTAFKNIPTHDSFTQLYLNEVAQELPAVEQALLEQLCTFETFDPFHSGTNIYSNPKSVVFTLKIALWALYWSQQDKSNMFAYPNFFPAYPFEKRNFETISTVPLLGQDANTYGSVTGALLAAAYPNLIPTRLIACVTNWKN